MMKPDLGSAVYYYSSKSIKMIYIYHLAIISLTIVSVRGEIFQSNNGNSDLSMIRKTLFVNHSSYYNFSQAIDNHDFLRGKTRIVPTNNSILLSSLNHHSNSSSNSKSGHHAMKNIHINMTNNSKPPSTVSMKFPSAELAIKKNRDYLYYLPTPEGFSSINTISR